MFLPEIRQPASQPSCADPLQRMFDRCTVFAILRHADAKRGIAGLVRPLSDHHSGAAYLSISGMNGISSRRPLASRVARIPPASGPGPIHQPEAERLLVGRGVRLRKMSSTEPVAAPSSRLQSYQSHLASEKRFGVALGRTALHAPDARQAAKSLVVKPLLER